MFKTNIWEIVKTALMAGVLLTTISAWSTITDAEFRQKTLTPYYVAQLNSIQQKLDEIKELLKK